MMKRREENGKQDEEPTEERVEMGSQEMEPAEKTTGGSRVEGGKIEAILRVLVEEAKQTRDLVRMVREGAESSELERVLGAKEQALMDLRALMGGTKRKKATG